MKRISIVLSMGLLVSLLTCANVWAQATVQISGSVQDQSGAVLPGVEITVTQIETGVTRTTITNETGNYVLPNLPLGPYRLEAGLAGFRTFVQTGIVLQVGSNPTLNVTLQVGEVSDQLEVQANATLVETQATGVGQLIENQRILELPLNGRVATDLIVLAGATTPVGVSSIASYPGTGFFAVNGGTANGTGFWLDGSTYTNPYDSSNLPFPFPDALQEFKVESSVLTAQNGLHAGATITAVVKSGTNSFHGDVFEFLRNSSLNGANFLSHLKDQLKRNQFGGTIGGPLRKDKLFFFAGYQGTVNRQTPVATSSLIPTPAMIRGDFRACPTAIPAAIQSQFTNNQIDPGLFDPAALKLASKLPNTTDPCGRTFFGLVTQTNEHQGVSRADYQISPRNSIFGRYIISKFDRPPSDAFDTNILATTQPGLDDTSQSWSIGNTFLVRPNVVSQARISVNRLGIRTFNGDFFSACDLGVPVYCGYTPHQSGFTVTGAFSVGGGLAAAQSVKETIYQINDDLSWSHGSHQVNFGGGAYMYKFGVVANVFSTTSWTFPSIPQFLLGQFSSNALALPNTIEQYKKFVNGYVQDTWKLSRKLTLNAGVRWEPFLPPVQYNGAVYNFDIARMIAGVKTTRYRNAPPGLIYPGDPGFQGKSGQQTHWGLFAPRLAIGYDPTGSGRTTIRAAYGTAYDFPSGWLSANQAAAPPFGGTQQWSGQFSNPFATNPGGNIFPYSVGPDAPFAVRGTYVVVQPDAKVTEVHQWNLVIQHQFGEDWLLSATYSGSQTEHLLTSYAINPAVVLPCPGGAAITTCNSTANQNSRRRFTVNNYPGNELFGPVQVFDNSGTSSYNGLILSIQKRLSKGVSINANHTWSHCISDLSVAATSGGANSGLVYPDNRRFDRSNCQSVSLGGTFSADRRHIFNFSTVYEVPRFGKSGWGLLASGWKLSGIYRASSAPWMTAVLTSDVALTGQSPATQRPVQVLPNPLCENPRPTCWINPAAFANPAPGTYSTLRRGNIPGPSFFQFDAAVSRIFRIHEGQTLELRGEAFNVTNSFRAGVAPPSSAAGGPGVSLTYGASNFGQVVNALDPRIVQLAAKIVF